MSTTNSDSDSEDARLREAVDPDFSKKSSGSDNNCDGGAKKKKKKKKKELSLRRDKTKNSSDDGGDTVSGTGLSVTKGFQEHVARKLSEAIEK